MSNEELLEEEALEPVEEVEGPKKARKKKVEEPEQVKFKEVVIKTAKKFSLIQTGEVSWKIEDDYKRLIAQGEGLAEGEKMLRGHAR